MHIEFVGPPGAGKSAIHKALTAREPWYDPGPKRASRRRFLDSADWTYRVPYRVAPATVRRSFESSFLASHFHREAFTNFALSHPKAVKSVALGIGSVEHQTSQLLSQLKDIIERYQIGLDTVREDERLCIDEGFTLGAAAILWRNPSDVFSVDQYFQHVPTPEAVIHVDAPPDLCLERQRKRKNIGIPAVRSGGDLHELQVAFQDLCTTIADRQRSRTTVVHVENTSDIDNAVERIEQALETP